MWCAGSEKMNSGVLPEWKRLVEAPSPAARVAVWGQYEAASVAASHVLASSIYNLDLVEATLAAGVTAETYIDLLAPK